MSQPLAYLYPEFLESADARPIRILAEYLEPLRRFKDQKIQDTVVFFGSARVQSRDRSERALQTLRARGDQDANAHFEAELARRRRAVEWARYYEDARELARLLTAWSLTLQADRHHALRQRLLGSGARFRPDGGMGRDRPEGYGAIAARRYARGSVRHPARAPGHPPSGTGDGAGGGRAGDREDTGITPWMP